MEFGEGIVAITGGASGIGAACAARFAAAGARVAVIDLDAASAARVADEIGGRAFMADVGDEASVLACAARIEAEFGRVSVLVNSAGIMQAPLRPFELDIETWDRVVRIDQRGTWIACLAFGRAMVARRAGTIVNIASVTALRSTPLHAYGPAKAAVVAMTESLAAEWGPERVRVNAVCPGYTLTPALAGKIESGERDPGEMTANAALGRLVQPAEIAEAVAFLASDRASAITGVSLPVDCGWLVAPPWHTYGGLRRNGV